MPRSQTPQKAAPGRKTIKTKKLNKILNSFTLQEILEYPDFHTKPQKITPNWTRREPVEQHGPDHPQLLWAPGQFGKRGDTRRKSIYRNLRDARRCQNEAGNFTKWSRSIASPIWVQYVHLFTSIYIYLHLLSSIYYEPSHRKKRVVVFNGHSRILNWRYLPYIRPIFQA